MQSELFINNSVFFSVLIFSYLIVPGCILAKRTGGLVLNARAPLLNGALSCYFSISCRAATSASSLLSISLFRFGVWMQLYLMALPGNLEDFITPGFIPEIAGSMWTVKIKCRLFLEVDTGCHPILCSLAIFLLMHSHQMLCRLLVINVFRQAYGFWYVTSFLHRMQLGMDDRLLVTLSEHV